MQYNSEHFAVIRGGHLCTGEIPGETPPPWHLSEKGIAELAALLEYELRGDFTVFAVLDTRDLIAVVTLRPSVSGKGIDIVPIDALPEGG
jgi:hypothetical protein